MSAATGTGRVGRPAGNDPATLAKGREFLVLADYGVSADAMAQRSGLSRSFVYYALGLARAELSAPVGGAGSDAAPAVAPLRKPRKTPVGTLLRRAYDAIRNSRAFKGLLDAETREFWVEALIEIREHSDDGLELTFGNRGDVFTSQEEFLSVFGMTEAHLAKLFRHSMLIDLDGAGVALPYRWNMRGSPARRAQVAMTAQRPLPFPFDVVQGGLDESEETPISSDSMSKEMPISSDSESEETPISSDSAGVARIAAAAAKDKVNQSSSSSSSAFPGRARESEEIAGESEEITPESEEIKTQRSLVAELAARANLGRPANPDDVGVVEGWLAAGLEARFLREVVDSVMRRRQEISPGGLKYFAGAVRDAVQAKAPRPAPPPPAALAPAAPAPPPPDELDPAAEVGTDPPAQWARVRRRLRAAVGAGDWRAWLVDLAFVRASDEEVLLSAPSAFTRDAATSRFGDKLRAIWRTEIPDLRWVKVCVGAA